MLLGVIGGVSGAGVGIGSGTGAGIGAGVGVGAGLGFHQLMIFVSIGPIMSPRLKLGLRYSVETPRFGLSAGTHREQSPYSFAHDIPE